MISVRAMNLKFKTRIIVACFIIAALNEIIARPISNVTYVSTYRRHIPQGVVGRTLCMLTPINITINSTFIYR